MEQMENLPEEEKDMVMQLPNSYFERGKEEGVKKGKQEGKQEIALELIARGMPIDQIAEITKLKIEDIEKLASE
ncbi:hypothetical protein GCM10011346_11170 [Oceanobacillus neutriphilus]|uniref:Transposase/invertase (TIGR01784 family) n=1 Tax=Oceanobacillus neutriphilus TaxID=531815 RepID=A0ABQ2NRQ4_9BACI|nr:hypothetical protein GCM10011346_11170 [Oceanobacillus neutriphilus]